MEEHGINERVRRLREMSLNTPPHLYMERARLETEFYGKFEGTVSVPELRAMNLKYFFEQKKLYLGKGELIVGEKGDGPQSAPTFPELCCHTLHDMHVMNDRELIHFAVTDDDLKMQEEAIIPFWEKRSIRRRIFENMSDEWKAAYECGIFTEFMEQRGPGHTVGSEKIYLKGFEDYKKDIGKCAGSPGFSA